MSESRMKRLKADIAIEQSELRIALRDHQYDRAFRIASMILEYVAQVRAYDMEESQEVVQ